MPKRHPLLLFLAVVLIGIAAPASAQSEREVEAAREQLDDATGRLHADRQFLNAADAWMAASITDFTELAGRLEQAAFAFAQLQEDVLANEVDLSLRRVEVSWLIRDAYADAMLSGPAAPLSTSVLDEVLLASDLMGRVAAQRTQVALDFEKAREQLEAAREDMEVARDLLTSLTAIAEARVDAAVEEANVAAVEVNESTAKEREAAAIYEDAVDRLEAALRSVPPRVLRWRPLVVEYFPEELQWQALEVILCESSGREKVKNPTENAVGLFQFLPGVWEVASEAAGFAGADRTDPEASIAAAAWLVEQTIADNHPDGPWGRWNCKPLS